MHGPLNVKQEKLSLNSDNIPVSSQQQLAYKIFSVWVNAYTKKCWKYTCVINYFWTVLRNCSKLQEFEHMDAVKSCD